MKSLIEVIKLQIIRALEHPEAEDGLYFNNLIVVHEEEERPIVAGEENDVKKALLELVDEGAVMSEGAGDTTIFRLSQKDAVASA